MSPGRLRLIACISTLWAMAVPAAITWESYGRRSGTLTAPSGPKEHPGVATGVRRVDVALDDVMVHQPDDDRGGFPLGSPDHG